MLHEVVAERLHYHKVCARWVPKMLKDEQVFIQKGIEHIEACQYKDSEEPTRIYIYEEELNRNNGLLVSYTV
jgi:hypothetical protein